MKYKFFLSILHIVTLFYSISYAQGLPDGIIVYVASKDSQPSDTQWKQDTCALVKRTLNKANPVDCLISNLQAVLKAKQSNTYRFIIELTRDSSGAVTAVIENLMPKDDVDFLKTSWTIANTGTPEEQSFYLTKKLDQFQTNVALDPLHRDRMLAIGSKSSKVIQVDSKTGEYKEIKTGNTLTYQEAESKFLAESPENKHYLRAAIEIGASLGVGALLYSTYFADLNSVDWDHQLTFDSQKRRLLFGEGIRFDSNPIMINSTHTIAGAYYYLFAKTNGMSTLASALVGLAASALWEAAVEFHEKFSVNDMFQTPISGIALGEALFQLGNFFDRGSPNTINNVLGGIFASPVGVHRWIDKNSRSKKVPTDTYGFPTDQWHQFDVFAGYGKTTAEGQSESKYSGETIFGFDTSISNLPYYGKEGKFDGAYLDTAFSDFGINFSIGEKALNDFRLFTKVALAGYFKQDVASKNDKFYGYSFYIGAATAFELAITRTQKNAELDQIGAVNILGPTIDLVYYHGALKIHASLDVYGDFIQIRSLAVNNLWEKNGFNDQLAAAAKSTDHTTEVDLMHGHFLRTKSELELDHSYYGIGLTEAGKLVVEYYGFEAGVKSQVDSVNSIDFGDRFQESIRKDRNYKATDHRIETSLWLAYRIPRTNVYIKATYEKKLRYGKIGGEKASSEVDRFLGTLLMRF